MTQPASKLEDHSSNSLRALARRRPLTVLLVVSVVITLAAQTVSLLLGWNVMPAKLLELVLLLGGAWLVTAWIGGRPAVRWLFAGLTRWRIGVAGYLLVLATMPVLTLTVAAITGTLTTAKDGWVNVVLTYLLFVVFGAVTGNLWEETAWSGFVQGRLMARHGLLAGSLLTAVPFFVIHLPLAFETDGLQGTSWTDALATWGFLLVSAPFFRYLIGTVLVDTGGSVLAAGLLHASFNASGALSVTRGGWQYIPAMIILTLLVTRYRMLRGRSAVQGYAANLPRDDASTGPEKDPAVATV